MLKTRILTALGLLAVLLPVLYSQSLIAFGIVAAIFLACAMWECVRLFARPQGIPAAVLWTLGFAACLKAEINGMALFALCLLSWTLGFVPMLKFGLPRLRSRWDRLVSVLYMLSIFACFIAMVELFRHSTLYLLSVLVLVWVADSGAYFVGRSIGKRKLAPSISPGKSWEGAIGGWISVLLAATLSLSVPGLHDTFAVHVYQQWGVVGGALVMSLLVAASVVGDLAESQLKRRAKLKDSSQLLPGHGGVLDRIDALVPVLPLAALITTLISPA
jgi:phosphatidate cytidylyltransferase